MFDYLARIVVLCILHIPYGPYSKVLPGRLMQLEICPAGIVWYTLILPTGRKTTKTIVLAYEDLWLTGFAFMQAAWRLGGYEYERDT